MSGLSSVIEEKRDYLSFRLAIFLSENPDELYFRLDSK